MENPTTAAELSEYIQGVLGEIQDRFSSMSGEILKKIDEMSGRLNELERHISELSGQEDGNAGSAM